MKTILLNLQSQVNDIDKRMIRLLGDEDGDCVQLSDIIKCRTLCQWQKFCKVVTKFSPVSLTMFNVKQGMVVGQCMRNCCSLNVI